MNTGMAKIKELSISELEKLKFDFKKAMNYAWEIFGEDAFRKRTSLKANRKAINRALFDTWAVNLSKIDSAKAETLILKKEEVINEFIKLMGEYNFFKSISTATGDKGRIEIRFNMVKKLIDSII